MTLTKVLESSERSAGNVQGQTWGELFRRAWALFRLWRWKEPAYCLECGDPMIRPAKHWNDWECRNEDCHANPRVIAAEAKERAALLNLEARQARPSLRSVWDETMSQQLMNTYHNIPPDELMGQEYSNAPRGFMAPVGSWILTPAGAEFDRKQKALEVQLGIMGPTDLKSFCS